MLRFKMLVEKWFFLKLYIDFNATKTEYRVTIPPGTFYDLANV